MAHQIRAIPSQARPLTPAIVMSPRLATPVAAAVLALLYGVIFFSRAGQLGFYVDDWGHVAQAAIEPFTQYARAWPFDYRPFDGLPWLVLYHAFGANVAPYYCLLFAVEYAASVTLFLVVRRLVGDVSLAFACALLWTVYPSDPSIFWLTTFAYRFGALFFLLAVWLLVAVNRGRDRLTYWAACLCCILCLFSNELYLGLTTLLPLLAAHLWGRSPLRAIAKAFPFVLAIASYLAYRRVLGPKIWHLQDNETGSVSFAPTDIFNTVGHGAVTQLIYGWMVAVSSTLHVSVSEVVLPTSAVFLVLLLMSSTLLALRRVKRAASKTAPKLDGLQPGVSAMLAGVVVLILGYVPLAFTAAVPTVNEIGSRTNAAATLGAPLFLAGTVWVAVYGSPTPLKLRRILFLVMIAAVAAIAGVREVHVAGNFQSAWHTQQRFWRAALPEIARAPRGTTLVLAAPRVTNWDTIDGQPQVEAPSAVSFGLRDTGVGMIVAYKQDLRACGVLYQHVAGQQLLNKFEPGGILFASARSVVPYSSVAVLTYDGRGSSTVREVRGHLPGEPSSCSLRSDASWGPAHGTLTAWGDFMTGNAMKGSALQGQTPSLP
jgi:hypothetical protein